MMRPLGGTLLVLVAAAAPALAHSGHDMGGFQSPDLQTGQSWDRYFVAKGTIGYHCHYHAPMIGTIVVEETGPAHANVRILDSGFEPKEVHVAPYGLVNWTNDGQLVHNAMEDHPETSSKASATGLLAALVGLVGAVLVLRRR